MTSDNPLLGDYGDVQLELLRIVAEPWSTSGRWPVFDYVDRVMAQRTGVDARSVIRTLPQIAEPVQGLSRYRAVWYHDRLASVDREKTIGLTIAGMAKTAMSGVGAGLVAFVGALAQQEAKLIADPAKSVTATVGRDKVAGMLGLLRREGGQLPAGDPLHFGGQLLLGETLLADILQFDEAGTLTAASLVPQLRVFGGVADIADYLQRTFIAFGGSMRRTPADAAPPPSLSDELERLDVVWQLRLGGRNQKHLLRQSSPTAYVVLDRGCASYQDLGAAMGALLDVLDSFDAGEQSAGPADTPLDRLQRRLDRELEGEVALEVREAIEVLRRARQARHGFAHRDAQARSAKALSELGVEFPVADAAAAWDTIRRAVGGALTTVRKEIYRSTTSRSAS